VDFNFVRQDWIHEGEGKEGGSSHQPGRRTTKAAAVADNAKVEADLRAQYVIVPPGDEAQVVSCPICKETLKSEFLEDDEEWVWKNATRKDDRVCASLFGCWLLYLICLIRFIMQLVMQKPLLLQVVSQLGYVLRKRMAVGLPLLRFIRWQVYSQGLE